MEQILLSFTDDQKYSIEFSPIDFWKSFAESYDALPWDDGTGKLRIVAENYSYMLDILVHARQFYLRRRYPESFPKGWQ